MTDWPPSREKIERVPWLLRLENDQNRDVYDPKAVSFGPYHYGKPELQFCQQAKQLTLKFFLEENDHGVEFFRGQALQMTPYARSCYILESRDNRFTDLEFAEMILLDACFLIYFIDMCSDGNLHHRDALFLYLGLPVIHSVHRDIHLIENQIPYRVLLHLISYKKNGEQQLFNYLQRIPLVPGEKILIQDFQLKQRTQPPLHCLEAIRSFLIGDHPETRIQIDAITDIRRYYTRTVRSVNDLRVKGIHCIPSSSRSLKAIKFNSSVFYGQLEIPPIYIGNTTKVLLPNLVAYELCTSNLSDITVTCYLDFMRRILIDSPSDVKELRDNRILLTALSDEEVARLFRDLKTYPSWNDFFEVKLRIQEHYNSKSKTWMAELVSTYFSSPWAIITWIAGLVLLFLSFLQTFYTIKQQK